LDVDDQRVTRGEVRDLLVGGEFADLLLLELFQQVHGFSPAAAPRAGRSGGRGSNGLGGFYWKDCGLSPVCRTFSAFRRAKVSACAPPRGRDGAIWSDSRPVHAARRRFWRGRRRSGPPGLAVLRTAAAGCTGGIRGGSRRSSLPCLTPVCPSR